MAVTISNITKVLKIIKTLRRENEISKLDTVKKLFYQRGIEEGTARINFEENLDFCKLSLFLETKEKEIKITDIGKKFLNESNDKERKRKLRLQCLKNDELINVISSSINQFHFENGDYSCEMEKFSENFVSITNWFEVLYDIEFFIRNRERESVEINSEISEELESQIKKMKIFQVLGKKPIPLSEQEKSREREEIENKLTGEIAEERVVEYEIMRLEKNGFKNESEKVKQISVDNSNAGYDIVSFSGKADELELPDRFIEVKGTTTNSFRFFWSKNEIETAERLRENYFIYFVSNINKKNRSGEIKEIIQDPFKEIFEDEEYVKKCQSYEITKK